MKNRKKSSGLSMIEIAIALIIVSILAAIAIPNYRKHLAKVRVSEVLQTCMPYAQEVMTKFYTKNGYPIVAEFRDLINRNNIYINIIKSCANTDTLASYEDTAFAKGNILQNIESDSDINSYAFTGGFDPEAAFISGITEGIGNNINFDLMQIRFSNDTSRKPNKLLGNKQMAFGVIYQKDSDGKFAGFKYICIHAGNIDNYQQLFGEGLYSPQDSVPMLEEEYVQSSCN